MVKNIKAGKRYRVISDDCNSFKPGDIVVALSEDDGVPYCILERYFKTVNKCLNNNRIFYHYVWPLTNYELEEIEGK